jgi:endonuclease YncB( thermonuclease family)
VNRYLLGKRSAMLLLTMLFVPVTPPNSAQAREISSYAFINEDGSLRIRRQTIHLYGIVIPPMERTCRTFVNPVRCGTRAVLALDFKIGASFVHCDIRRENPDRTLVGVCTADGVDLAAYLLERGWAAALPDAPQLYTVLERIARTRGIGIWGFTGETGR